MGIEHIRNLIAMDGTAIVCIADDFPDSIVSCVEMLRLEYPNWEEVRTFTNVRELASADLCDVVIIATPNNTHHRVLLQAYEHAPGRVSFLVEKPLCTTIEHCREVVSAASARIGVTYVGLEYCYMPPITRVLKDAKRGLVGAPIMCAIREHRFPFLRKVRDWNRFSCNSGGTLVEKTCHFFDLFSRVFASRSPQSVFASGAQDVNHLDEKYNGQTPDILDNAYVVINYGEGRRAMLDLCMFAEASQSQEEVVIVGARGKLEAFLPQLEVRTGIRGTHALDKVVVEKVDDDRIRYQGHHHGSSYLEHLDFLKVVSGDTDSVPAAGLYQGLLSVAIGVAAQKSIEEDRLVLMTEIVTTNELELGSYK